MSVASPGVPYLFSFGNIRFAEDISLFLLGQHLFVADQRTHALDVEVDQILAVLLADPESGAAADRFNLFQRSLLFHDNQRQPLADVTLALLDKQIRRTWIMTYIVVGQTVGHDEGTSSVVVLLQKSGLA